MSVFVGAKIRCDRCGAEEFMVCDKAADDGNPTSDMANVYAKKHFSRMFGWVFDLKTETGSTFDLCPKCVEDYRDVLDLFFDGAIDIKEIMREKGLYCHGD